MSVSFQNGLDNCMEEGRRIHSTLWDLESKLQWSKVVYTPNQVHRLPGQVHRVNRSLDFRPCPRMSGVGLFLGIERH